MLETAALFSEEDLTRYLNLTLATYKSVQESLQPRLHLEVGLIKLVQAGKLQSIEEAIAELGKAPVPQTPRITVPAVQPPPQGEKSPPASEQKEQGLRERLSAGLAAAGMSASADAVQESEVRLEGSEVVIRAPKSLTLALRDAAVARTAAQVVGKPVRMRIEIDENSNRAQKPREQPVPESSGVRERALSHPGVKHFQEVFPDAQVRTVRDLNE